MSQRLALTSFSEPDLLFGYGQRMEHPKDGLLLFGPYDNPFSGGRLRIGLVATADGARRYSQYVRSLSTAIPPARPNDPNHTIFPGFQAIFGTEWPETPAVSLNIDQEALASAIRMEDRHQAIYRGVGIYAEAIIQHLRNAEETSVDLWIVVLPEDVHRLGRPQSKVSKEERIGSELLMNRKVATRILKAPSLFEEDNTAAQIYLYDLDFHNQLKARLLSHRAAVQIVRETTLVPEDFKKSNGMPLRRLQDPATLAWNLATTCFFKAGGRPWRLGSPRPGVCYVGIVFKKDFSSPEPGSACCGAQMFMDSGDGVVFRGAVGPWLTRGKDEFHLPREKARELMSLVVDAYRSSHLGRNPTELFVHGKTRFSAEEWDGFKDAVPPECNVVCVRIRTEPGLKLFRLGMTNIQRGLGWIRSETQAWLWTKGFVPRLQTYPGREVPNPLAIEICRGCAEIGTVMGDVMALTKLNYNACLFADGVPVTLRFANSVGEILTAAPRQDSLPPLPFRFYI
jgi:hypothetical protein